MKKIKTNSFFVTIYEIKNKKFIMRKKRNGLHAYPRTMKLKDINKILKQTSINYPRIYLNGINNVYEEFIDSKIDMKTLSNSEVMNNVIKCISILYQVTDNKNTLWDSNSEFLRFQINNLKNVLKEKKLKTIDTYLDDIDRLYTQVDNNRKLCFIHCDIHRKNMIINDKFYLIDWELATYGDLAYELAMHFILMEYNDKEKEIFLNKLCDNISINIETLKHDINTYTNFEKYRKNILKEIKE